MHLASQYPPSIEKEEILTMLMHAPKVDTKMYLLQASSTSVDPHKTIVFMPLKTICQTPEKFHLSSLTFRIYIRILSFR